MLAVGILWSLFTLMGISMFLPPITRYLREWEIRYKPARLPRQPTYPQRIVYLLLTLLMTAVSMSAAFHRDLRATIGITPGTACVLMLVLPALYFTLGWLGKRHKNGQGPAA